MAPRLPLNRDTALETAPWPIRLRVHWLVQPAILCKIIARSPKISGVQSWVQSWLLSWRVRHHGFLSLSPFYRSSQVQNTLASLVRNGRPKFFRLRLPGHNDSQENLQWLVVSAQLLVRLILQIFQLHTKRVFSVTVKTYFLINGHLYYQKTIALLRTHQSINRWPDPDSSWTQTKHTMLML